MSYKISLGKYGEQLAQKYLISKEYKIIETNYHTKEGEIDIICRKGQTVFFIEVRTKKSLNFGTPIESLTVAKQEHFINACFQWLDENNFEDIDWQIDFIGILLYRNNRVKRFNHIENVFFNM